MLLLEQRRHADGRPDHLPVLIDARHEFLTVWQPAGSGVVDAWVAWFDRTETAYEIRRRGGLAMIYTHRVVTEGGTAPRGPGHAGLRRPRWCCGGDVRFDVGPEDWGDV